jgi:hypothetical protein
MSLGDVALIFGLLVLHAVALPGLALTWGLLCPGVVARSRMRLERTPGRSFLLGLAGLMIGTLLIGIGFAMGPVVGWFGIGLLLAIASVGAAGLAGLMGERLRAEGVATSSAGGLLRGAIALELAVVVPVIGWFVVLPLGTVVMLGSATFALLRWQPRAAAPPPLAWPMPDQRAMPMAYTAQTPMLPVQLPTDRAAWAETGGHHAPHTS